MQLTRHTHTHTHTHALMYAHTQSPVNKTNTHATASGRYCCKLSLFCPCSPRSWHSFLACHQAGPFPSFAFPPSSLLLGSYLIPSNPLFHFAYSCSAVCIAFIKARGRIPAIAMGPDQLDKSCRWLRGGVGTEGAHVAVEGLGVYPASVYGA